MVAKFEGEAEIDAAILGGLVDDMIKELLERRAVFKIAQLLSRRPHTPEASSPQLGFREADGKMMEMERRVEAAERTVEELERQKEELQEALRCARTATMGEESEGIREQVLIQKADTTEVSHLPPCPPSPSPSPSMPLMTQHQMCHCYYGDLYLLLLPWLPSHHRWDMVCPHQWLLRVWKVPV